MTEKFVYLGYGITDSNGIAKLDHDANGDAISHSYTGTGAGKIDVVGSLEDISDLTINLNPSTINDNSSGTTHTITATVLDDNVAVQNEEVTFEVRKQSDNSLVTTLTCTTNSSGVATVSYSGIGAGVLNIKCYCSFLTKTCEVTDCIVFDKGLQGDGNHNDIWDYISQNIEVTRGSDGTTVKSLVNNGHFFANTGATGNYDFTSPCRIEFDFELLNGTIQLQLYDTDNESFVQYISTTGHYIININSDNVSWSINGQSYTGKTVSLENFLFRFTCGLNGEFKFSNFKIYPI